MTELERRIDKVVSSLTAKGVTGKTLSGIKKTLNSSSHIVDAVNNFGDNLQDNLEDVIGGVTGTIGGWVVGKSTKLVGGVAGGIVAGTLKTVAGIIPDASDIKLPESDKKVAHSVDTCPIPSEPNELYEMLQYISNTLNSSSIPYGKRTIESLKALHTKVYSTLHQIARDDKNLLMLSKNFAPKKRFGIF